MRQSRLFTKVERNAPKDEVAASAALLTRAGFIRKVSAGVYAYLPLGWRVMEKIMAVIRGEMNAIGGQELFMPALVEKRYLEATGREDLDVGFEVKARGEKNAPYTLGWTHEEVLTALAAKFVKSYKDLPFYAYQIQTKFRNEARPQGGLLRTREFIMKDLYSFHASEGDLRDYYEEVKGAYKKIFERCGLHAFLTLAPGGDFTLSTTHEFQVPSEVGEDTIFLCESCEYAENKDISTLKGGDRCPRCGGKAVERKAIEVGNIFLLGTKYAEALSLAFKDEKGKTRPVVMGSYGIGVSRLMGTAAEIFHDAHGLLWPFSLAPYTAHLLELEGASVGELYADLQKEGIEVLYDERKISAAHKLVEADLLGIPWRVLASSKTGEKVEVKRRGEEKVKLMNFKEAKDFLRSSVRETSIISL